LGRRVGPPTANDRVRPGAHAMLTIALVDEIKRLLAEGQASQRQIARLTGVSRSTVGAIASGKRAERPPQTADGDELPRPTGPLGRCAGCGGLVYTPCLLCRVRALEAPMARLSAAEPGTYRITSVGRSPSPCAVMDRGAAFPSRTNPLSRSAAETGEQWPAPERCRHQRPSNRPDVHGPGMWATRWAP
jgi:hypothetical protein